MREKRKYYDEAFFEVFTNPRIIEALLYDFIGEGWTRLIDIGSMSIVPSSFKNSESSKRESDLLLSFKYRETLKHKACAGGFYLYLLLEFQSSPEPMVIRLLEYLSRIYERQSEEGKVLYPVVPIVIYNGARRWGESPELLDRFSRMPEDLLPYIPRFRYVLIDERSYSDEVLSRLKNALSYFFLLDKTDLCDKSEAEERIIDIFRELWEEQPDTFELLGSYIRGLLSYRNVEIESIEEYIERRRRPMLAQSMDRLIEQGREEGIEKGIEKGRKEGTLLEKQDVLIRLVSRKFGITETEEELIKSVKNTKLLDKAIDELLFAQTKEELLLLLR
ncbi:MAG: Rpn family recombination-promoting nuclease/putative transposase [Spirochaetaceae bacterium]